MASKLVTATVQQLCRRQQQQHLLRQPARRTLQLQVHRIFSSWRTAASTPATPAAAGQQGQRERPQPRHPLHRRALNRRRQQQQFRMWMPTMPMTMVSARNATSTHPAFVVFRVLPRYERQTAYCAVARRRCSCGCCSEATLRTYRGVRTH